MRSDGSLCTWHKKNIVDLQKRHLEAEYFRLPFG
jgi:hypothetical protein